MSSDRPLSSKIATFLEQNLDLYSTSVPLFFQGKKKVSLLLGLIVTVIVIFLMLAYILFKGTILIRRSQYSTQMAQILNPQNYSAPEIVQLNEYGFDIAFNTMFSIDPEYGELVVQKVTRDSEKMTDADNDAEVKKLELITCGDNGFNHTNQEEVVLLDIPTQFLCIKNKSDLAIGGTFRSTIYLYLEILLIPFQNSSENGITCKPQDEIDAFFGEQYLGLVISNNYFDKDNDDEPIQSFIDDSIYWTIVPTQKVFHEYFVSISELKLLSSINHWSIPKEIKFSMLEKYTENFATLNYRNTVAYVQVGLRLDSWSNIYDKRVYSFTDFVSEVGGMFNSIFGIGKFVVFLFLDSLLIKRFLYELYSQAPSTKFVSSGQSSKPNTNVQQTSALIEEVKSRKPLYLPWFLILYKYISCFSCCKSNKVSRNYDNDNHEQSTDRARSLYQKGQQKLINEFDIISLFKMIREFKVMKHVLFRSQEFLLFTLQKDQVLDSDESEDEEWSSILKNGRIESQMKRNPVQNAYELKNLMNELENIRSENSNDVRIKLLTSGILRKKALFERVKTYKAKKNSKEQASLKSMIGANQTSRRMFRQDEPSISFEQEEEVRGNKAKQRASKYKKKERHKEVLYESSDEERIQPKKITKEKARKVKGQKDPSDKEK